MMKSTTMIGAVALAAAVAGSSSAFAQDQDWSVTLGIKGWLNVWDTKKNTTAGELGSSVGSQTSDYTLAGIPSVALKYKDFFISSSYFLNRNYDFPATTTVIAIDNPAGGFPLAFPVTFRTSAKRKEFDINIGWYFVPQVAVTLGYKQVNQQYTDDISVPVSPPIIDPFTYVSTTKNKAPTIGIVAGGTIGNSDFLMYFNGSSSIGPTMKATFSDNSASYKGWYASGELGFGYRIVPGLTATLGYKYQVIDVKIDDISPTQRGRDVTNGPIFGVAYTF